MVDHQHHVVDEDQKVEKVVKKVNLKDMIKVMTKVGIKVGIKDIKVKVNMIRGIKEKDM